MLPFLDIPIGRGAGALLLLLAAGWWWFWTRRAAARPDEGARRWLALAPALMGLGLLVLGQVTSVRLPTYGAMLLAGSVSGLALSAWWARARGISPELLVDMAILGIVCGLVGARAVFIVEQWDNVFADRPATFSLARVGQPLAPGDALRLRTARGEATVVFDGGEATLTAVKERLEAQAGAIGLEVLLKTVQHRGPAGVEQFERGLLLRTADRGPRAFLEVLPSPAAPRLGLHAERHLGQAISRWSILDLRMGGLTYFGAVFGVLVSWFVLLRIKKVSAVALMDLVAPILPLGLFFGRLGCLSYGCCWGREAGPGALVSCSFPPWSPAWHQMAQERLTLDFDRYLGQRTIAPAMEAPLADILAGTPPLHATQLYEGVGVLLIFLFLVAYRRLWQRRVGQAFALLFLLQAPLRFVVEHFRRDHDVFLRLPGVGYPLTESQTVAALLMIGAVPAMLWVSRRGQPLPGRGDPAPPASDAGQPVGADEPAPAAEEA